MKFTLTIELGNDAMQTYEDLGNCLQSLAIDFHDTPPDVTPGVPDGYKLRDMNGYNTVGTWQVVE
jgi:hypothetical protein